MKNKLRLLTTTTLVLGSAAAAYLLAEPAIKKWKAEGEQAAALHDAETTASSLRRVAAANIPIDTAGDRQLLLAIARLEQRDSVTARIQHQAHVAGLRLDGKGEYLQQGRGTRRHVRWLLESQHEGVRASLLQSSNGRFLWTDRHIAAGRRIQRVDLWQLRRMNKAANTSPDGRTNASAPFTPQLAGSFGGLPMLLESLRTHFEFTQPGTFRPPENLGLGNQPVLGLVGRWRAESLAAVLADLSDIDDQTLTTEIMNKQLEKRLAGNSLPKQLPLNVLVLLGQNDLFPYLIEYRSADDLLAHEDLPSESLFQLSRQPLARLEFYDVAFDRQISTVEFLYEPPAEPNWIDGTDSYVARVQKMQTIRTVQQRARRLANGQNASRRN